MRAEQLTMAEKIAAESDAALTVADSARAAELRRRAAAEPDLCDAAQGRAAGVCAPGFGGRPPDGLWAAVRAGEGPVDGAPT